MDKAALVARLESKLEKSSGCWIWTRGKTHNGYGQAHVNRQHVRAHRLAWILWRGDIPDGLFVLHKCDTPACCNPDHLFLGTDLDNCNDKIAKGRSVRGENHPRSKLKASQVLEIRKAKGAAHVVAKHYGVSKDTIESIRSKRLWRWLT